MQISGSLRHTKTTENCKSIKMNGALEAPKGWKIAPNASFWWIATPTFRITTPGRPGLFSVFLFTATCEHWKAFRRGIHCQYSRSDSKTFQRPSRTQHFRNQIWLVYIPNRICSSSLHPWLAWNQMVDEGTLLFKIHIHLHSHQPFISTTGNFVPYVSACFIGLTSQVGRFLTHIRQHVESLLAHWRQCHDDDDAMMQWLWSHKNISVLMIKDSENDEFWIHHLDMNDHEWI